MFGKKENDILVWLPTPMGDAILCIPALRSLRQSFEDSRISFLGNKVVEEILSPCRFNDRWITYRKTNPFQFAKELKQYNFSHSILFKNSFGSALSCFLAGIPVRAGYCREARRLFLTEKLVPPKLSAFKYKPASMIDYYFAIVSRLGCNTKDRSLELHTKEKDRKTLTAKIPEVDENSKPLIIFVPGGSFGPSKCWLTKRFAQTADRLIENYKAKVVVSVSQASAEKQIAEEICNFSKHKLINLGQRPVNLGELKALFSLADIVITNDTGPRHIAIAFKRNIITLFGPNDPAWTETEYENEIKIVGEAECAPCARPVCKKEKHLCMESITVDRVFEAARKLLGKTG